MRAEKARRYGVAKVVAVRAVRLRRMTTSREKRCTGNGGGTRTGSDGGNPDEWAEGAYHLRRETQSVVERVGARSLDAVLEAARITGAIAHTVWSMVERGISGQHLAFLAYPLLQYGRRGQAGADTGLHALIVDAGALPLLVALLRAGTEKGKASAEGAIAWLASNAPTRTLILGEGALPPLIALLRTGTEEGKEHAAAAIVWLTNDAPTRALIVEAGALLLLVALLRASTKESKASAAGAISWLASEAPTCALIVEAGALPLLVALLRAGTDKGKASATAAIFWLASEALIRALVVDADALPPLIALHTCNVLQKLAADARLRELTEEYGAADTLAAAVHAPPGCGWAEAVRTALRVLCPTQDDAERALGGTHLKSCALVAERDLENCGLRADGVVKPDPNFLSAAHRALLGQLHATGHAPLPASLDERLELLYLAAKVRATRSARTTACAADMPGLVDAAHAVVVEHVAAVVKQPEWLGFEEKYPKAAVGIMRGIALKLASVVTDQADVLAQLNP
ncbi:armadillo-type protein [Pavlovales sp. CCMP2436]|nr:armadillo-type protein [Pavlovales sp. CCMP2436]